MREPVVPANLCTSIADVLAVLQQRGLHVGNATLCVDHRCLQTRAAALVGIWLVVPGRRVDPREFLPTVLADNPCVLALVEYDAAWCARHPLFANHPAVLLVHNLVGMMASLAAAFYQTATNPLRIVAVTGTNGKTTISRWLAQTLNALGVPAAVLGTLGYGAPNALREGSGLTTPNVVDVHRIVHELHAEGFAVLCLEASSIGLLQGRLQGLSIDIAVFSNLTQDHLDVHGTMQAYGEAKLLLAQWPGLRSAVVNVDCVFGKTFARVAAAHGANVFAVGAGDDVDVQRGKVSYAPMGLEFELKLQDQLLRLSVPVLGDFNADNLALVAAVLHCAWPQPVSVERLALALPQVSPPPGRMQWVCKQPAVVVDYAHTPDALRNALLALRPLAMARQGRLGVLFGCGGNRDRGKRALMGHVAAHHADWQVLTTDNPRFENPADILQDIVQGFGDVQPMPSWHGELDRKVAIAWALEKTIGSMHSNDVLLLAGKGHEQTQEHNGKYEAHCDITVACLYLEERGIACQR